MKDAPELEDIDVDKLREWACERMVEAIAAGKIAPGVRAIVNRSYVAGHRAALRNRC